MLLPSEFIALSVCFKLHTLVMLFYPTLNSRSIHMPVVHDNITFSLWWKASKHRATSKALFLC